MKQIKKVGVVQTAKVMAVLYLIGSTIIFVPVTIVGFFWGLDKVKGVQALFFLLMPLVYCALGFIGISAVGLLYNFVASKIGGVSLEIEEK